MNDQQLIAALRGLDRPVAPDAAFGEALFVQLQRQARVRPQPLGRRELLLVAALLAAAAVGFAVAAGLGLFEAPKIVTLPSAAPTDQATLAPPTLRPPATLEPIGEGFIATPAPVSSDAPFGPPPWDPGVTLELTGSGGRTITPTVLAIPGAEQAPSIGPLVLRGDLLWALVTQVYFDDPPRLLRVDTATDAVTTVPLPDAIGLGGSLVPGPDNELWAGSGDSVVELDPVSGEVIRTLSIGGEGGSLVGVEPDGIWLRVVGGILFIDRETGAELRRIESLEGEGQAYTGIWQAPAFGSLWNLDRNAGFLRRLDPVSGEETARIFLAEEDPTGCSPLDLAPLAGLGLPDAVIVHCPSGSLLVDPSTNEVAGVLPNAGSVVADGAWWSVRSAADERPGWDAPAELVRIDPTTGGDVATWSLSLPRTGTFARPVVAGDSLWLVIGERPSTNTAFDWNSVLVRIPIAELNG